jgi:hypothetical protein
MMTLSSHALQSLYVFCFKPFKTTFKKVRDAAMSRSNHMEPDKIILARWMDQALEQSLTKKTSSLGLQLQEYGL